MELFLEITLKLKKIADRMGISINELNDIRRRTLDNAKKMVSEIKSTSGTVKNAADIALVSSEKTA